MANSARSIQLRPSEPYLSQYPHTHRKSAYPRRHQILRVEHGQHPAWRLCAFMTRANANSGRGKLRSLAANNGSIYSFTHLTGRELDRKWGNLPKVPILQRLPLCSDVNHRHLRYSWILYMPNSVAVIDVTEKSDYRRGCAAGK